MRATAAYFSAQSTLKDTQLHGAIFVACVCRKLAGALAYDVPAIWLWIAPGRGVDGCDRAFERVSAIHWN
jgi:hypothetical protein